VLHLLHGWSDRDKTTGHLRRRSTVQHHSAINQPPSAPVNVVRKQHLPSSTRHLLRLHLQPSTSTVYSAHSLSDYISHSLGILSFGLHRRGLFTMDYRTSTSPWINSIGLPLRSWTTNSII